MSTTLTLKNIREDVYERLKRSAEIHCRSVSCDAIVGLETVLLPTKLTSGARLALDWR